MPPSAPNVADVRVVPVNPVHVGTTLFGQPVRAHLGELDEPVVRGEMRHGDGRRDRGRERAAALGGSSTATALPDGGTRLEWWVPLG